MGKKERAIEILKSFFSNEYGYLPGTSVHRYKNCRGPLIVATSAEGMGVNYAQSYTSKIALRPQRLLLMLRLLQPSGSLSCLTKCAPCPPMANNHFEDTCLSMSGATNIHMRKGFVVQFEFHFALCDVFFPTLLFTLQACLQCGQLCIPHGLLFLCTKYGSGCGNHHIHRTHTPMHALFCRAFHI